MMIILIIVISIFIFMNKSSKELFLYDDSIDHITKDAFLSTKDDYELINRFIISFEINILFSSYVIGFSLCGV